MIRRAVPDDFAALQDIERRAGERFRDVGMPDIAAHEPYSDEELAAAEVVLVATDDEGVPLGYAMVGLVDGHAHLEGLAVMPDAGRRGVGTSLLEAVADWARARGDEQVTLTTFRDVPFNAPRLCTCGAKGSGPKARFNAASAYFCLDGARDIAESGTISRRRIVSQLFVASENSRRAVRCRPDPTCVVPQ